jgi:drug/metabolite transporter (DMT)-like permease
MSNNQFGVLLIFAGMLFFSIQDVLIKKIVLEVSLIQIIVIRSFFGCVMLSLFLYLTKRKITFGSSYPVIAIFRGGLFFFWVYFVLHSSKQNQPCGSYKSIFHKSTFHDNSFKGYP